MIRIGFVTCVQLGLSCMEALYAAGGELSLIVTLEDDQAMSKSGRVYLDSFSQKNNIPLLKSRHINDEEVVTAIQSYDLDLLFIIGWSQIASEKILLAPKQGVLGMHPTLLPQGRGRAAIPWAILKCLPQTGVTLFKLDAGIDTGPVVDRIQITLTKDTTATELYEQVNSAHTQLMYKVIPHILSGNLLLEEQDESKATEWPGRGPEDGEINLHGSVYDAERLIRAVTKPYPGAFIWQGDEKIIIWKARCISKKTNSFCLEFYDGFLECTEFEKTP